MSKGGSSKTCLMWTDGWRVRAETLQRGGKRPVGWEGGRFLKRGLVLQRELEEPVVPFYAEFVADVHPVVLDSALADKEF